MRVKAAPEAVWAVLTAVENYPRWRSDVAAVADLRAEPGLTWRETDSLGRATLHAEGQSRVSEKWIDRTLGADGKGSGQRVFLIVADEEGGSRVALTETREIANPLLRFKARFVDGYGVDAEKLMGDLRKRLAE